MTLDYTSTEQTLDRQVLAAGQESALFHGLKNCLPENHPTSAHLRTVLRDILTAADRPADALRLLVYQGKHPDAHVSPFVREVRASQTLLSVLNYRTDLVAPILAHEVGHWLLDHHERTVSEQKFDPLEDHTLGYEHEYQADRVSLLLLGRMGLERTGLAEALSRLHDFYEKGKRKKNGIRGSEIPWILPMKRNNSWHG